MVTPAGDGASPDDAMPDHNNDADDAAYEQLQEVWPAERPSRRRRVKHGRRRRDERQIRVRAERLDPPDTARLSHALLTAQRELAQARAERDARAQENQPDRSSRTEVEG